MLLVESRSQHFPGHVRMDLWRYDAPVFREHIVILDFFRGSQPVSQEQLHSLAKFIELNPPSLN